MPTEPICTVAVAMAGITRAAETLHVVADQEVGCDD